VTLVIEIPDRDQPLLKEQKEDGGDSNKLPQFELGLDDVHVGKFYEHNNSI
jgi:hypothetical protein